MSLNGNRLHTKWLKLGDKFLNNILFFKYSIFMVLQKNILAICINFGLLLLQFWEISVD